MITKELREYVENFHFEDILNVFDGIDIFYTCLERHPHYDFLKSNDFDEILKIVENKIEL